MGFSAKLVHDDQHGDDRRDDDADQIQRAAAEGDLDGGQEAGTDEGVFLGQRALGLCFQQGVGQAAEHQHGGQGDDEGRDRKLGNEESDECACREADGQSCDDGDEHVHFIVDHHDACDCAGAGNDGADAQVDVTGQDAEEHTDCKDDDISVLHDQVVDVCRGGILSAGQDREDDEHRDQGNDHAVLLHIKIDCLSVFHDFFLSGAQAFWPLAALSAMMNFMMPSCETFSLSTSPAMCPLLMT